MTERDVGLFHNWPPLPSVMESCSQESRVNYSSLLPTSCSVRVMPPWMKPSVKEPVLNISEQPVCSVFRSTIALNVTNSDDLAVFCQYKCYPELLGCSETSLIWRLTTSWHDSLSYFIIYGRDCVQAAALLLWRRRLQGCWDEGNLFIGRWRGWPRWHIPVVTALYTEAACHFVGLLVATQHFCVSLKTKQFLWR